MGTGRGTGGEAPKRSWNPGRVAGIDVRVRATFALLLALGNVHEFPAIRAALGVGGRRPAAWARAALDPRRG
ncbi:MAG: hypothetical protein FJ087_22405 [Deltaproteobacteria bacterium]|nr:hypothetical protein [Deltaproteobacteria bacterium]